MICVYILQSAADVEHFYVDISNDLKSRLRQHNAGEVFHMAKYRPWTLKNYFAFEDEQKAYAFERYLKSGSGRAFAKKHF
jgi:predicted GIY-YIG superfamily endonuclease